MHSFPHHYEAHVVGSSDGPLKTDAKELPTLNVNAPIEFDGAGDCWSPEDLLVGIVGDCFILTFRSVAKASKLEWIELSCNVKGTLDKVDGVLRFTEISIQATLTIPASADAGKATKVLEKAERVCLITNSLSSKIHLKPIVIINP